jgi:hypothetical protein
MIFYTYHYKKNIENFVDYIDYINELLDTNKNDKKDNTEPVEKTYIKKNIKNIKSEIIYLELSKDEKDDKDIKNTSIFYFYNSNKDKYMICKYTILNYQTELILTNLDNKVIGNLINEIHNKIILKIDYYKTNIVIEYLNNLNKIKIYLDDDDKYFYIYKNNNLYNIDLYQLNIGYISLDKSKENMYRISVNEKYKNYLNLFAIGYILLFNN